MKDKINPNHYKSGNVECIEALESATVNKSGLEAVCVANIIKYLWRYENKNGLEDIKKAQWYLEKLIKIYTNEQIRKNQQPNESLAQVSERGIKDQKRCEEPTLQEQLRESIEHSRCSDSGTIRMWISDNESPTRGESYYYSIPFGEWGIHGKFVSSHGTRHEQSPANWFCY